MAAERPDRWLVVTVRSPSADQRALAAEGLVASGADAVEERADAVITWLRAAGEGEPDKTLDTVSRRLAAFGVTDAEVVGEWRAAKDWLAQWREGLRPRRVGDRLVVAPSWAEPVTTEDTVTVVIDPQMAFGTGEHASTRGVLRLMQTRIRPGHVVLDVGTGSAILAIAAALLGAAHAHGVESDEDALINASENVAANGVADRVTLEEAAVDAGYLEARTGSYDLILANVLSGVLLPLLPAFATALRADGALILAGILRSEADTMVGAASSAGFVLHAEDREEEWWSGLFSRRG